MPRLAGSSKLLRAMNETAALGHLLDRGRLTRGELRELTGLSKPTTSDVLRRLTDAGLAVVVGHTSGGPGPNAEIYAANPAAGYAVALSIRDDAGTPRPELAAGLCDLTGAVLARTEQPVDRASGPEDLVAEAVAEVCAGARVPVDQVTHVHLGVPGDVTRWHRPGLAGALAGRLGATVAVDDDANLAAIAERGRGAAREADGFALLWFGSGLGLAVDLGGTLLRGARGGTGGIGYLPLGGTDRRTDLRELVGGQAVVRLAAEHGFTATTPEIAVAEAVAAGGTPFLEALADRVALALAAVAAVLDPPMVVLAGGVAQAGGPALRDAVAAALTRSTPFDTTVEVTALTDDAVLLGGLDASLRVVREALIDSLRQTTVDGLRWRT